MITVYTRPGCVMCDWTKRKLAARGLAYTEIDVTTDADAEKMLRDKGITTLPFVHTDHDEWSGFKIEKIRGVHP